MNKNKHLRNFYILWGTQSLSQLGSSITAYALTLWLYDVTGSSLDTAALRICTYAPYVLVSIFAGALSDKFDKKKTMLICDLLAAVSTVMVLVLYKTNLLCVWHLYLINVISGLMNTFQQPASEVAFTLITPKDCYQKTGVLQALSRSLITIGHPIIAAAVYGIAGLEAAIALDMVTFLIAFLALALFIKLSEVSRESTQGKGTIRLAREGLSYLKSKPMILYVILFMAGVNLISSAFEATLPGYIKPNPLGGNYVLGIVSSCSGIAMILGSLIFTKMPKPKDRVRVIYLSMLFSLGTENFILAFSRSPVLWCIGQILGWIFVPVMSANQNVIMRNEIPVELQGRVYACRNTLQFFTIPIGLFLGGFLVDNICEPYMRDSSYALSFFFGSGKGSGAAMVLFILGVAGTVMCLVFGRILKKYSYSD